MYNTRGTDRGKDIVMSILPFVSAKGVNNVVHIMHVVNSKRETRGTATLVQIKL